MKKILFVLWLTICFYCVEAASGIYASAVYLSINGSTSFFNTLKPGNTQNIGINDFSGNIGTYIGNSAALLLKGAEIKTYKDANGNVCIGKFCYRVYLSNTTPGPFITLDLPFYSNCTGNPCNGFPNSFDFGGGCCNPNDQKWQEVNQAIDLTANPPGTYTLDVYYYSTGSTQNNTDCNENLYDSNNGSNYSVTFTITGAQPVIFGNIEAIIHDNALDLTWISEKEINCSRYDIYASSDGIEFNKIGEVESKAPTGNSSVSLTYNFIKTINKTSIAFLFGICILIVVSIISTIKSKKFILAHFGLLMIFFFFISCSRKDVNSEAEPKRLFIKIVQLDLDGKKHESKIIQAVFE